MSAGSRQLFTLADGLRGTLTQEPVLFAEVTAVNSGPSLPVLDSQVSLGAIPITAHRPLKPSHIQNDQFCSNKPSHKLMSKNPLQISHYLPLWIFQVRRNRT